MVEIKTVQTRRTSLEADFSRCFIVTRGDASAVESLATKWERDRSLGVEMGEIGEIEGNVGERRFQLVGLFYFLVVGVE